MAEIGRENVDKVLPCGIFESERRDQSVSESHQNGTAPYQSSQLSPSRHDYAGNDATDQCRKRWDSKASAGCSRGIEQNDLEEQWQHEQVLGQLLATSQFLPEWSCTYTVSCHASTDVRQLSRNRQSAFQKPEWDDRDRSCVGLNPEE